jgi:hypothetical protein
MEALLGRETEFVRTPKHGIRGKLESWTGKKYRAARSVTPYIEMALAGYFVVAVGFAFRNGHYLSLPFLCLFLCGFAYVGWLSLWQGNLGTALRRLFSRGNRVTSVVPPPAYPALAQPLANPVQTMRESSLTNPLRSEA